MPALSHERVRLTQLLLTSFILWFPAVVGINSQSCFAWNLYRCRAIRKQLPGESNDLLAHIPSAIGIAIFLLLFMGNFGHNLFRFTWLWYGGFLIVARQCLELRLAESYEPAVEAVVEEEMLDVPEGWIYHTGERA